MTGQARPKHASIMRPSLGAERKTGWDSVTKVSARIRCAEAGTDTYHSHCPAEAHPRQELLAHDWEYEAAHTATRGDDSKR